MSEFDGFDEMVNDLMQAAIRLLEGSRPAGGPMPLHDANREKDEVIQGRDRVTYVLEAPGHEAGDFSVHVEREGVEVSAHDLRVSRRLPAPVDPKTAVTRYSNGVLSVSARRV